MGGFQGGVEAKRRKVLKGKAAAFRCMRTPATQPVDAKWEKKKGPGEDVESRGRKFEVVPLDQAGFLLGFCSLEWKF